MWLQGQQTALCCWMMTYSDINPSLFVCNTYISNHLCIRARACACAHACTHARTLACRSQWFPVMFLWGSPSWFLTQEFPTEPGGLLFQWAFCLSLTSSQVTADRGKPLSECGGLRSLWLHSKNYSVSHIHSPPLFFWWDGNCLNWPWTYTVTQAGYERASFCGSAYRVDRILGMANIWFLPLQLLWGLYVCSSLILSGSFLYAGYAPKVTWEKRHFSVC